MIGVVGGGVMGCTLTYVLAAHGLPVTLFERGVVGQGGASGGPVALLNPYRGRSARASPFDLESLAATWRLVAELGGPGHVTGVRRSGVLRVASNAKQARGWRKRDGVRWLEPGDVPAAYHAPFGGFVAPQGGWLEPQLWLRTLVRAARVRGALTHEHCEVARLEPGAPHTLHTTAGTFTASQVVLCSGASLTLGQGVLGLAHVAGEVVAFAPVAPPPYPLAGAVYGASLGRTFYLGGNHRPAGEADETAPAQLQRAGGWFVPALKGAQLESVWHGVRAKTPDNQPLVTRLGPGLWFAGALAGRGFLGAATVARTVADALALDTASPTC